jgi:hypothetical protein
MFSAAFSSQLTAPTLPQRLPALAALALAPNPILGVAEPLRVLFACARAAPDAACASLAPLSADLMAAIKTHVPDAASPPLLVGLGAIIGSARPRSGATALAPGAAAAARRSRRRSTREAESHPAESVHRSVPDGLGSSASGSRDGTAGTAGTNGFSGYSDVEIQWSVRDTLSVLDSPTALTAERALTGRVVAACSLPASPAGLSLHPLTRAFAVTAIPSERGAVIVDVEPCSVAGQLTASHSVNCVCYVPSGSAIVLGGANVSLMDPERPNTAVSVLRTEPVSALVPMPAMGPSIVALASQAPVHATSTSNAIPTGQVLLYDTRQRSIALRLSVGAAGAVTHLAAHSGSAPVLAAATRHSLALLDPVAGITAAGLAATQLEDSFVTALTWHRSVAVVATDGRAPGCFCLPFPQFASAFGARTGGFAANSSIGGYKDNGIVSILGLPRPASALTSCFGSNVFAACHDALGAVSLRPSVVATPTFRGVRVSDPDGVVPLPEATRRGFGARIAAAASGGSSSPAVSSMEAMEELPQCRALASVWADATLRIIV